MICAAGGSVMKQAKGTLDWPMGMEIRRLGEGRGLVAL